MSEGGFKVGDRVSIPWWEGECGGKMHRVPNLEGRIIHIDGAYHDVHITNNKKYRVIELYPVEMFKMKGKK